MFNSGARTGTIGRRGCRRAGENDLTEKRSRYARKDSVASPWGLGAVDRSLRLIVAAGDLDEN